jgi:hypothetical protein
MNAEMPGFRPEFRDFRNRSSDCSATPRTYSSTDYHCHLRKIPSVPFLQCNFPTPQTSQFNRNLAKARRICKLYRL